MKPASVLPCFPNTTRGVGTPLKTDPKRNLMLYALDRTVRAVLPRLALALNDSWAGGNTRNPLGSPRR